MKLMRYGAKGAEKPALIDADGAVRDLSGVLADITAATLGKDGHVCGAECYCVERAGMSINAILQ